MPVFEIQSEGGPSIEVDAPDYAQAKAAYDRAAATTNRSAKPSAGYVGNLEQMLQEGSTQAATGLRQLGSGFEFAGSGAGRNVVADTPSNRIAGAFGALNPTGPQAPLTEAEHAAANQQAVGNVVKGFGNTVQGGMGVAGAPLNAAMRTYIGEPIEKATGIPKEIPEIGASLLLPGAISRAIPAIGRLASRAPSVEAIRDAARAGFQSPAVKSLEIRPAPVATWAQSTKGDLTNSGLGDVVADKTWRTVSALENVPAGAKVTGNDLHALRQQLGKIAQEVDPATRRATPDAAAATKAIKSLDEFINAGIKRTDVIAGDPASAAKIWKEARGNWASATKADKLDMIQFRAELRAAAANSGQNIDNTLRQRMVDIMADPAKARSFSKDEQKLMQRVIEGSDTRNTLRFTSNMMGGGGGVGMPIVAAIGGAATAGAPIPFAGAALPLVGMALKKMQNALAVRELDQLHTLIRSGSPLARRLGGPLQDFAKHLQAFDVAPTARNLAQISIASRNLSTNLKDANINVDPEKLVRSAIAPPAASE